MTKLDIALRLAGQGMAVFPLRERGNTPVLKQWEQRASKEPDAIREMWSDVFSGEPRNFNIGIAAGPSGLIILDVDVKDGKQGDKALAHIVEQHGALPVTLRVRTPSGGIHYYLRGEPVRSRVNWPGHGIDVRSAGGYVVGPGSETAKGVYKIMQEL